MQFHSDKIIMIITVMYSKCIGGSQSDLKCALRFMRVHCDVTMNARVILQTRLHLVKFCRKIMLRFH